MGLSLEKKTELVKLTLEKRNVPSDIVLQVKSCIDISGSIQPYFNDGTIQELVDRLLAVAVRFDDNQTMEQYAFGSDAVRLSDVTPKDFGGYIKKKFLKEAGDSGQLWSGTNYSKALRLILNDIGGESSEKKGGFLSGLFSKKDSVQAKPEKIIPSYLMFITDGDTMYGDEPRTDSLINLMRDKNVYIQLIGVGRGSRFEFLNEMADKYDHVGFVTFPLLEKVSDEQMYSDLLGEELCTWIKQF